MSQIDAAIIIEAQAKLIKSQSLEIIALEQKLEAREYNKRYTNTKFKNPIAGVSTNTAKPGELVYVQANGSIKPTKRTGKK